MQRIVICSDVGGLQLHHWAFMRYFELKGIKVELVDMYLGKEDDIIECYDTWFKANPYGTIYYHFHKDNTGVIDDPYGTGLNNGYFDDMYHLDRSDPILHQVLEEGTEERPSTENGYKYVEIPDDVKWHIWQEDGPMVEHICENARSWS